MTKVTVLSVKESLAIGKITLRFAMVRFFTRRLGICCWNWGTRQIPDGIGNCQTSWHLSVGRLDRSGIEMGPHDSLADCLMACRILLIS